jgi:hypothetical protein
MRDTIELAREVGFELDCTSLEWHKRIKAFEALVRADEREEANRSANASWTLMCEKMVAAEREACAQLCEDQWQTAHDIQDAIRARGNT